MRFTSTEEERVMVKMQSFGGFIVFRNLTTLELNSLSSLEKKGLVRFDRYIELGPVDHDAVASQETDTTVPRVAPGYRLVRSMFALMGGKA